MQKLGEVQYDTGIPKYYYNVRPVVERPNPLSLGQSSIFTPNVSSVSSGPSGSSVQFGPSAFQQATGMVGTVGNITASIVSSFNQKEVDKRRIKMEERVQSLQIQMSHMTEKERIAANIEITRIRSEMELLAQQESSKFGIGMTQILALAGVGSIGLIGMFAVMSQQNK